MFAIRSGRSMRITLDIDADLLALIREAAAQRGVSIGQVASDLIRAGSQAIPATATLRNGFPVRAAARGQPPITSRLVRRLLAGR
jgi:hypothetical protein